MYFLYCSVNFTVEMSDIANCSLNENSPSVPNDSDLFSSPLVIILCILTTSGLIGSLGILFLSMFGRDLNGDFKYFVANIAFIGVLTESAWLAFTICQYIPRAGQTCSYGVELVIGITETGSYLASVLVPIPNSISQFVLLRSEIGSAIYSKYFQIKLIFLYFLIVDLYAYVFAVIMEFFPTIYLSLIYGLSFVISYILNAVLPLGIYCTVKRGFEISTLALSASERKARREVVNALLYQACMPIVLVLPQLIMLIIQLAVLLTNFEGDSDLLIMIGSILSSLTMITITLNPITNVFIVFLVLKPYRKLLQTTLARIFPSLSAIQTTRVTRIATLSRVDPLNVQQARRPANAIIVETVA